MDLVLNPTAFGAAAAAFAVAGGAPLFGEGLRTVRLRAGLAKLVEQPLEDTATGLVSVRGRVALESPLFGPLSGLPCAGFVLEARAKGPRVIAAVEELRAFKLVGDGEVARVVATNGRWELEVSHERTFGPEESLSENLKALVAGSAEVQWLRRRGHSITLTERALLAGATCHVIGRARHAQPFEAMAEVEMLRTGTDDGPGFATTASPASSAQRVEPDLWIDDGGNLELIHVSDRAPRPTALAPSPFFLIGLVIGPLISLLGLLYLANAADYLRSHGRF